MMNKEIFSRIIHKHDTKENWAKATNFVPKLGEIIIYDPDELTEESYDEEGNLLPNIFPYSRFKIGDGVKTIPQLGFYMEEQLEEKFSEIWQEIIHLQGELDKKLEGDVLGRTLNLYNNL